MTIPATGAYFHGRPDTDSMGHVVAHRGASRIAPENTLAAFRMADRQNTRWIEFDVSLLGDGTPVVHHDPTLDRCTNHTGSLTELNGTDLAGIDAGGWFGPQFTGEPLATLEQTFDLIGEIGLSANLEMKPHGAAPEPLALVVANALASRPWARSNILVSSFNFGILAALRELMPVQPLAMLYKKPPADWPQVLSALDASSLHIWHEYLNADILSLALLKGFHVRVFTINEPARMAPFRANGLTGVITDHPPLFLNDPEWAKWASQ